MAVGKSSRWLEVSTHNILQVAVIFHTKVYEAQVKSRDRKDLTVENYRRILVKIMLRI